MPDCPASSQSGTGMKKTNDAGTGPGLHSPAFFVSGSGCRNTDAGVSLLDADPQLCLNLVCCDSPC